MLLGIRQPHKTRKNDLIEYPQLAQHSRIKGDNKKLQVLCLCAVLRRSNKKVGEKAFTFQCSTNKDDPEAATSSTRCFWFNLKMSGSRKRTKTKPGSYILSLLSLLGAPLLTERQLPGETTTMQCYEVARVKENLKKLCFVCSNWGSLSRFLCPHLREKAKDDPVTQLRFNTKELSIAR